MNKSQNKNLSLNPKIKKLKQNKLQRKKNRAQKVKAKYNKKLNLKKNHQKFKKSKNQQSKLSKRDQKTSLIKYNKLRKQRASFQMILVIKLNKV